MHAIIKFVYSEKAAKFCEIFTLLLSYVVPVKSKVNILQNFVAFSEYMNFISLNLNDNYTINSMPIPGSYRHILSAYTFIRFLSLRVTQQM